jgi:hypothetical protein
VLLPKPRSKRRKQRNYCVRIEHPTLNNQDRTYPDASSSEPKTMPSSAGFV